MPSSVSEKISVLRTFVIYELSKENLLLERLIDSDFSVLSKEQRTIVLDGILQGIISTGRSEKIEGQLRKLFENTSENREALFMLLTSMEKLEVSGEARKAFHESLSKILKSLPGLDRFPEIQRRVVRLFESPSSLC